MRVYMWVFMARVAGVTTRPVSFSTRVFCRSVVGVFFEEPDTSAGNPRSGRRRSPHAESGCERASANSRKPFTKPSTPRTACVEQKQHF